MHKCIKCGEKIFVGTLEICSDCSWKVRKEMLAEDMARFYKSVDNFVKAAEKRINQRKGEDSNGEEKRS